MAHRPPASLIDGIGVSNESEQSSRTIGSSPVPDRQRDLTNNPFVDRQTDPSATPSDNGFASPYESFGDEDESNPYLSSENDLDPRYYSTTRPAFSHNMPYREGMIPGSLNVPISQFSGASHANYSQSSGLNSYQPYFEDGLLPETTLEDNSEFVYMDSYDNSKRKNNRYSRAGIPQSAGFLGRMKDMLSFKKKDVYDMDFPLTDTRVQQPMAMGEATASGGVTRNAAATNFDASVRKPKFDFKSWAYDLLSRRKVDPATLGPRVIYLNNPMANRANKYLDNHISTSKYNIVTFVPKFLFEQFSKYANLFFLMTCIIQQVPNVSPTNRYTTIITLGLVLCVSAVKELFEDFKRHNADKDLNNAKVRVFNNGVFETRKWVQVAVGDIVRVESEEPLPADMVLLASSEPEGLCYIETANLDGETNLKIKQTIPETALLVSPADLNHLSGSIKSEQPNSSLYTYDATLTLESTGSEKDLALTPDQLLLRVSL